MHASRSGAVLLFAIFLAACAEPSPLPADPPPNPPAKAPPSAEAPASVWEKARQDGIDFRGVGNEPGWLLEIRDGETLVLMTDYGQTRHVFPAPHADATVAEYDLDAGGHRLRVTLEDGLCEDTMSGETFPTTVTVRLDTQTLHGCGRALR